MANPRRMVRRSLVANNLSPQLAEARQREIDQHRPVRRASMLAIHACTTKRPRLTAATLGIRYKDWDAEYLGSGFEFTVFRISEDEVIKIAHNTVSMPKHVQRAYAESRQREHRHMASWLGDFVLPQTIGVAPLPFMPSQTAVQARQPYRDIIDPHLFNLDKPDIDAASVADMLSEHPGSDMQLGDFIERSRSLYGAEELLPDTNGHSNLVMSDEAVLMVDGQPISTEHQPVQRTILGQLASLELAMA